MKKILYLFLFSLILTTLFFNKPVSAYENTEYGFTIDPPMWELEENTGIDGIPVAFINLDTGAAIVVVIEEYALGTLEDFVNENKEDLTENLDDYNIVSERSRVIGGLDCYEIVYTESHSGNEMKTKVVMFLENGVVYLLACTSIGLDYSDHLDDFENTVTSFRLTSEVETSEVETSEVLSLDWIIIGIIIFCLIVAILLIVYFFKIKKEKDPQTTEKKPTEI